MALVSIMAEGGCEGAREVEIYICSALATQVGKWNQCDVALSSSHTHGADFGHDPITAFQQCAWCGLWWGKGREGGYRRGRLWGTAIAPLFSQITNLYRRNGCLAYLKNQSIRIEFVCALISFWTTFCCTHCCCCCSCCTHCCYVCCSHCCSCCSHCCSCCSPCCSCSSRNRFGCRFCFYYFYSLVSSPTT